ncbi:MAG TPA: hypothetical protein VGB14_09780 [Acidimicrobiales bacterium]|jgi:hypothetical protein
MTGIDDLARDLQQLGEGAEARAVSTVGAFGSRLHSEVTGRAAAVLEQGTSDDRNRGYVPSIGVQYGKDRKRPTATVGTNHDAGFRNEQGYHGTDKLGRRVSQPPRSHWGPATDAVYDDFVEAVGEVGLPG